MSKKHWQLGEKQTSLIEKPEKFKEIKFEKSKESQLA